MTMAGFYKQGPRVRHGRQSGLRDEADISGLTILAGEHLQEGFHLFRPCVLVEFSEFQLTDVAFKAGGGKVAAGGASLFDHISFNGADTLQNRSGDHLGRSVISQRGRNKE